ncbi:MAG: hypothetical protein GY952_15450 [Rhodobacteraceae bacterium]|nr:hypothetical protein [Paracoccaceae bacterium]
MPFLLSLIAIAGAAYFWFWRARNAADVATDMLDVANDVRLAARRFGFKRHSNRHPVEGIDDPKVAVTAIACAFFELDELPTQDQRNALLTQVALVLRTDKAGAEELTVLGRWLMTQCQGPAEAINRVSRRLHKIDGINSLEPLMTIIQNTLTATEAILNANQKSGLEDIQRALRV